MQWGYPQPRSGEGDAQRDEEAGGLSELAAGRGLGAEEVEDVEPVTD
jgi:hypothetical protein